MQTVKCIVVDSPQIVKRGRLGVDDISDILHPVWRTRYFIDSALLSP